jgi:hypothetical protein
MLFYIDSSGYTKDGTPCAVLAGVAVLEDRLWNVVQGLEWLGRSILFIDEPTSGDLKGRELLQKLPEQLESGLESMKRADVLAALKATGKWRGFGGLPPRERQAWALQARSYVEGVFQICEWNSVTAVGSIAAKSVLDNPADHERGYLSQDQVNLLHSIFTLMEAKYPGQRAYLHLDNEDHEIMKRLSKSMGRYLAATDAGRDIAEVVLYPPTFVDSAIAPIITIADVVAYCMNWAYRIRPRMSEAVRPELRNFAKRIAGLAKYEKEGRIEWTIKYTADLRSAWERERVVEAEELQEEQTQEDQEPPEHERG